MSLLEVSNLAFGYAGDLLFDGVTFRLNAGERAGLVAPNGAGKSTLLRLIAGEATPDKGAVMLEKGKTLGFYRQSHETSRTGNVMDVLLSGFGEVVALRHELAAAQHAAASGEQADLDRLSAVMDKHHALGADALEHRVAAIASRLGFPGESLAREVSSLSGGEHGRLALGAVLATEPDVLLLDEPTNHLDLETIDWLSELLCRHRGAALVVSHDRAFLDAVCPITLELGKTKFRQYPLPFTEYQSARAEDLARESKQAEEQAAFVARTEDFIRRNIAGQKTKQAQSRRKMLEKLDRIGRPEDTWARAERVRFRFADAPRSGDIVLEATKLGASRGGKRLFSGVDLLVRRTEKIGIVGPNGSGKTTLLKLLSGSGEPGDSGSVRRGTNLRDGYFDQHLGSLAPKLSAIEEIRAVRGDLTVEAVREYLARFRFYGDDPFRKVGSLSGGEQSRLALAKLLLEPRNLLFLDEPTNHLDIFAAEILEEALVDFEGTVVLVSHDRRFLENVTTRVVAFTERGGFVQPPGAALTRPPPPAHGVEVFGAGFSDYEATLGRRKQTSERVDPTKNAQGWTEAALERENAGSGVDPHPGTSADEHRIRRAAARELEKKRRRAERLENEIAEGEKDLFALREELRQAPGDDWEKLHVLSQKEQALKKRVDSLMTEWERLSTDLARAPDIEGSEV